MDFFFRCLAVFLGMTVLLILVGEFLLQNPLPFAMNLLLGTFTGLVLAILYGWIDEVYLQHGRSKLKE